MKISKRMIYGILLTAIVFLLATLAGRNINLNINFLPYSFVTHTTLLILSITLICGLKKHVKYNMAWPKFKKTLKPILFGFLAAIIVNTFMVALTKGLGGEVESHFAFDLMSQPKSLNVFSAIAINSLALSLVLNSEAYFGVQAKLCFFLIVFSYCLYFSSIYKVSF
jgi:fumarate reductase subunit D